jgi:hypothetical protein
MGPAANAHQAILRIFGPAVISTVFGGLAVGRLAVTRELSSELFSNISSRRERALAFTDSIPVSRTTVRTVQR